MKDYFKEITNISDLYSVQINIPDEIPDEMPKYVESLGERLAKFKDHSNIEEMHAFFAVEESGSLKELRLKSAFNDAGMFGFVSWKWVNPFVEWIGTKRVLEVMAGRGWLTHALRIKGVPVIATDDFSWANGGGWKEPLTQVDHLDAIESVKLYGEQIDILIISWPYMNDTAYEVLKELHKVNPTALCVYIGEGPGGCTASDKFFSHFEDEHEMENASKWVEVQDNFQRWHGFHDRPAVGRYRK
ncbi:hypothetical protein [Peribacillus frigoritolerans]|uniref:SAM-dependent methyltransferase n=1 Tax=Peribacillus castrilensis TaxID=2897690 RepID=A0AAW9NPL1_9BACI|nr:hypothetical protein [Peribacillus castrilensis]